MRWLALFSLPMLGFAELLKIEMGFGGMECASCTEFIESRMTRNRAVQSVHMDKEKGVLRLELKAGNKLRLEHVRDLVQQSGFTPKETRLAAVGVPRAGVFQISESGQEFRLRDAKDLLKGLADQRCRVEAEVETQADRSFLLVVRKAQAGE